MEPQQTQVLNVERVQALDAWLKATSTKLKQVNGQRKYGGPPEGWDGPTPGARCEVFISQIPRDTYEDLLIPLFSSVGPLWEFRLMMNFSGQNRGFAYAKYGTAAVATEAIRLLHGYVMEPGCHLSVRRSTEKRHLCIGNLPSATRQDDLLQVLHVLAEGVERVSLKAGPGIKGVSAIVAFLSHHAASMAKKVLVEGFKRLFSLDVTVKWLSVEKPNPNESRGLQKAPKTPQPPCQKQRAQKSPQPSVPLPHPHPLALTPSILPEYCRAVGGPTAPLHPHPKHSQRCLVLAASPVILLSKICEASGLGQPLYEVFYSHTGPDGFLNFTYNVHIPGLSSTFKGMVMILPGPDANATFKEAERATAQQVLQRVHNNQLAA